MAIFGYKLTKVSNSNLPNTTDNTLINKINQALLGMGIGFVKYDDNNKTYVNAGYNSNSDVYAVVSQKATEITRIPYYIKSIKDMEDKERFNQFRLMIKGLLTPDIAIRKAKIETKAFEEELYKMPLEKPNLNQSWREFFALYETFMDLTGNFYIYLVAPEEGMNKGTPKEIYILPAHLMQIVLKPKANLIQDENPIDHYTLIEGDSYIKFEQENVIHVKYPNPNFDLKGSHLYGQAPLRASRSNLQSSNSATTLNAKTLANGGSFGFISTKEPLTHEQALSLKDSLVEMDNSTKRLSNIAGSSKEVVFTRLSLTADELKPFDYLEYDQKAICNVLHWDDKLLNSDDGAKYDNYKTALRRAITSGVSPNLRLLEECFNTQLLPRFKGYENTVLIFDESQLPEMQEDMEKLTKWLNDALDRGVINRDEYRAAINYEEIGTPEMLTHTVSMNTLSLEDAITPAENIDFNIDESNELP
jgi:HK97 family phage portal protein